tara:strand:- start:757 stop:1227 length:471 start_codon:yes stop_codon:yes gene_type:complete
MFGLIIIMIGIAVFSVFMAAGSNYIDGDKLRASAQRAEIQSAVNQYGSGIVQFNLLFGRNPSSVSHISPALVDPPKMPDGVGAVSIQDYSVSSMKKTGVCFSANNVPYSTYLAVAELKTLMSEGQVRITESCSSLNEIAAPVSYPANFNFIYLVRT